MKREFERYGLPNYRILTGTLQLLGSLGLVVGFRFPVIGLMAAVGLCVLMLLGSLVRRRIGESWTKTMPAISYMLLSLYLASVYLLEQVRQIQD